MEPLSLDDFQWLVSSLAEPALRQASELLAAKTNLVRCVQTLRKEFSSAQAHLALETVELRLRARDKFTQADRMFFTRTSLEQATDERIASYKASRFPTGAVVADWCTGIGGDLLALAERGPWLGADRDPVLQLLLAHNIAKLRGVDVSAVRANLHSEIVATHLPPDGYWHLDPDRRASGKRSVRLETFSPPLEFIEQLRCTRPNGALKIAPASDVPADWVPEVQREWISRDGECRQQVIWFGSLASAPGEHQATILGGVQQAPGHVLGQPHAEMSAANEVQAYLYEPDPAVLAAELTGALAQQSGLAPIATGSVYLTGDKAVTHMALASFRILDQLPFDRRRLQGYFRERRIGRLEIKKRGVDCQPEQVRKSLALQGENAATLIITRIGARNVALIAERCP